jgi:hypothetical protein
MRTLRKGLTSKFAGALLCRTWWAGSPMGTAATPGRAGWEKSLGGLRAVAVQDKHPERPGNLSRRLSLISVKGVKSGTPEVTSF